MTDLLRAFAAAAWREQRERIAKGIAVLKTAKKAGLPIKAAVVRGVTLELGEPDAAVKPAPDDEVEAWIKKQQQQHHAH